MTPCINFEGALDKDGYGRIISNGIEIKAHRLAYIKKYGSIPEGYEIHHICENRRCINDEHLEAITKAKHNKLHKTITHCKRGHELTLENTRFKGDGKRQCKVCEKARLKKAYDTRKSSREVSTSN